MTEKEPHIVWEDHDHAYVWSLVFDYLREKGFKVTVFGYLTMDMESERERLLENADLYVVHSGSVNPPDMSQRLNAIKNKHDIKVMLQTEVVNELTQQYIDGVISVHDMLELKELECKLRKVLFS